MSNLHEILRLAAIDAADLMEDVAYWSVDYNPIFGRYIVAFRPQYNAPLIQIIVDETVSINDHNNLKLQDYLICQVRMWQDGKRHG